MAAIATLNAKNAPNSRKAFLRILVVEDDKVDFCAIERHLTATSSAYFLIHASTIADALQAIQFNRFDAALVDNQLPDGSGVELIRTLGGCLSPFPLIMLTGFDNCEVEDLALKAGAIEFLHKNALTQELLHRSILYSVRHFEILKELKRVKEFAESAAHSKQLLVRMNCELGQLDNIFGEIRTALSSKKIADGSANLIGKAECFHTRLSALLANCADVDNSIAPAAMHGAGEMTQKNSLPRSDMRKRVTELSEVINTAKSKENEAGEAPLHRHGLTGA